MNWLNLFFSLFLLVLLFKSNFCGNPVDNCPKLPPHTPKDVNDLAPSNIKVVIALGDSITAGFGIMGLSGYLDEFRGLSGASGGDLESISLSNFIKHYSGDVYGSSFGSHLVELPGEGYYDNDNLNVAQSGATTDNLDYQVEYLFLDILKNFNLLKQNTTLLNNEWKALNLLIGANDACPYCYYLFDRPTVQEAGDIFEKNVEAVIAKVQANIPKVFFNILPLFNLSGVYNLSIKSDYCAYLHDVIPFECICAFDSDWENRLYLDNVVTEYANRVIKLSKKWKAKKLPDFTVEYQPFTIGLDLPIAFLSTLDCFHPSLMAHQQVAIAGWNSLITPYAKKPTTFSANNTFICADANSRLFTY